MDSGLLGKKSIEADRERDWVVNNEPFQDLPYELLTEILMKVGKYPPRNMYEYMLLDESSPFYNLLAIYFDVPERMSIEEDKRGRYLTGILDDPQYYKFDAVKCYAYVFERVDKLRTPLLKTAIIRSFGSVAEYESYKIAVWIFNNKLENIEAYGGDEITYNNILGTIVEKLWFIDDRKSLAKFMLDKYFDKVSLTNIVIAIIGRGTLDQLEEILRDYRDAGRINYRYCLEMAIWYGRLAFVKLLVTQGDVQPQMTMDLYNVPVEKLNVLRCLDYVVKNNGMKVTIHADTVRDFSLPGSIAFMEWYLKYRNHTRTREYLYQDYLDCIFTFDKSYNKPFVESSYFMNSLIHGNREMMDGRFFVWYSESKTARIDNGSSYTNSNHLVEIGRAVKKSDFSTALSYYTGYVNEHRIFGRLSEDRLKHAYDTARL